MPSTEKQKLLAKADAAAYAHLRETYQSEFNEVKAKAAAELGIEWSPRLTGVEAARKKVNDLLLQNPELAAEIKAEVLASVNAEQPTDVQHEL